MSNAFSDYRIEKELGSLGHWTLHGASAPDGQPVVLAVLPKAHCPDDAMAQRILDRLIDLEALDAPGVMAYLDSGETDECVWYTTAAFPVQPAETLLGRAEPLRPLQVLHHGVFLARTLAACHRQGVFHGKVDLRHIFFDDAWRVYLGLLVLDGDGCVPPDSGSAHRDAVELLDALCQLAPVDDAATASPAARALASIRDEAARQGRIGAAEVEAKLQAEADRILRALEERASGAEVVATRPDPMAGSRWGVLWGALSVLVFAALIGLIYRGFFYVLPPGELMNRAEELASTDSIAQWERARRNLRQLRDRYPGAPEAEEAIALLDDLSERISERRRATQQYLTGRDPGPSELNEAAEILARRHFEEAMQLIDEGHPEAARARLTALVELMPGTAFGKKAAEQLETFEPALR